MVIGSKIKRVRIKLGLTQTELGNLIGVSKVSICGYETGVRTPRMDILLKIINVLKIDLEEVLGIDSLLISEEDESYKMMVSKDDIEIIKELRKHPELYNKICIDPKRTIELISRKIK